MVRRCRVALTLLLVVVVWVPTTSAFHGAWDATFDLLEMEENVGGAVERTSDAVLRDTDWTCSPKPSCWHPFGGEGYDGDLWMKVCGQQDRMECHDGPSPDLPDTRPETRDAPRPLERVDPPAGDEAPGRDRGTAPPSRWTDGGAAVGPVSSAGRPGSPIAPSDGGVPFPALVWATGIGLFAWALYRLIRDDELLDHELRARLVALVEEEPGLYASQVARRLDVDPTTVLYHGRRLAEANLLVVRKTGGRVVYMPANDGRTAVERATVAALRRDAKAHLLRRIADDPGVGLLELARRTDRAPSTVRHHLDGLLEDGVVEDAGGAHGRSLRLTPVARRLVEP